MAELSEVVTSQQRTVLVVRQATEVRKRFVCLK